jgi:hypothetical protein
LLLNGRAGALQPRRGHPPAQSGADPPRVASPA